MSGEDVSGTNRDKAAAPAHDDAGAQGAPPPISRGLLLTAVFIMLLVAIVIGVVGILHRVHANSELEKYTDANAAPPVALAQPVLETSAREIVLPGNIQAFTL